jgi:hypothetical protein
MHPRKFEPCPDAGNAAAGSICPDNLDQPLVHTHQGCLGSKEDAVYLVEACLLGKHFHARRGPRDGEAATVREEVSKAIDGSGLVEMAISIPACDCIHHMVSYYKAGSAIPPSSPIFTSLISREPTLGRDGDLDRDDDLDWVHVQGHSLPVVETEYVPAISHLSTCLY